MNDDRRITRCEVIESFGLPARAATAVVVLVISGNPSSGMWLWEKGVTRGWYVVGIEFPTPKMMRKGWTSLLVARTDEPPRAGTVLVAAT